MPSKEALEQALNTSLDKYITQIKKIDMDRENWYKHFGGFIDNLKALTAEIKGIIKKIKINPDYYRREVEPYTTWTVEAIGTFQGIPVEFTTETETFEAEYFDDRGEK